MVDFLKMEVCGVCFSGALTGTERKRWRAKNFNSENIKEGLIKYEKSKNWLWCAKLCRMILNNHWQLKTYLHPSIKDILERGE